MFYSKSTGGFYSREIHGNNMPADSVEITADEHAALLAGQSVGKIITADSSGKPFLSDPPAPTQTQTQVIAQYETALDNHLDAVAKANRYDDRKSFALRAGYPGPYQTEGAAFGSWMDACNAQAYALMADVLAGDAELPTVSDFLATLPVFVKP